MLPITHKLDFSSPFTRVVIGVIITTVFAGIMTGFFLATNPSVLNLNAKTPAKEESLVTAVSQNSSASCKDTATGTLEKMPRTSDGTYTDGTHILQGTNEQTVAALTSSTIDLSQYVGKVVKVCGETQKSETQNWLIDVASVTVQK